MQIKSNGKKNTHTHETKKEKTKNQEEKEREMEGGEIPCQTGQEGEYPRICQVEVPRPEEALKFS